MSSDSLAKQFRQWATGIRYEIEFWDDWMRTGGREWKQDFERRVAGNDEMADRFLAGLKDPLAAKFLDVGAGPLSMHGPRHQGHRLNLTCVDPLAPYYANLGAKYGIKISTKQGFAEDLTALFDENSFDRVTCVNALDHSFDPVRGVEEMLRVASIGGKIFLEHTINEAEFENYSGFHQWNFDEEGGDFIIWSKTFGRVNVTEHFSGIASVEINCDREHRYISVVATKLADLKEPLFDRLRQRNQAILGAALAVFADV